MKIARACLADCAGLRGAVVVIDVLRSFTTAAYALAGGAREVVAVATLAQALALRSQDAGARVIAAVGGGATAAGADLGNSPSALAGGVAPDLRGRRVLLTTAGGTQGLVDCAGADLLLASSLVCARATATWLLRRAPPEVTLVDTGRWSDRDGDEDLACADLIEALLRGDDPSRAPFEARVRGSDFGRRFGTAGCPQLPAGDLDCCAAADRFDFAMPVQRGPFGAVIRRDALA